MHTSRYGVIPKCHQINKWHLIVDLSHPLEHSVNNFIPNTLCGLSFQCIQMIGTYWPCSGTIKFTLMAAYFLAYTQHQGNGWPSLVDCNTAGYTLYPPLPQWFLNNWSSTLYTPIRPTQVYSALQHAPWESLLHLRRLRAHPPHWESPWITHLMEARLPQDKLTRKGEMLSQWLSKKKASKSKILSLVGMLQHATKVVKCGCTFRSRMYTTATKLRKQHHYTRFNRPFRSELTWWYTFLQHWNGLSILRDPSVSSTPLVIIQTDVSRLWDGAVVQSTITFGPNSDGQRNGRMKM